MAVTAQNMLGIGGHYAGVGVYSPGDPWRRLTGDQPAAQGAARTSDDQAVFVVVDSNTGEIRSCGDLSGYCIGMNPWAKPLAAGHTIPAALAPPPPEPAAK